MPKGVYQRHHLQDDEAQSRNERIYVLSNGAVLGVTFEGNFLTLNKQEYAAMKQLLDVLDLLRVPIKEQEVK